MPDPVKTVKEAGLPWRSLCGTSQDLQQPGGEILDLLPSGAHRADASRAAVLAGTAPYQIKSPRQNLGVQVIETLGQAEALRRPIVERDCRTSRLL